MKTVKTLLSLFIFLFTLSMCDEDKKNDSSDNASGNESSTIAPGKIILTSSQLTDTALATENPENCEFSLDIYRATGSCITPTAYVGYSRFLDASNTNESDPDIGSARIAGIAGANEEPGAFYTGSEFSLSDTKSFTGNNELWSQYNSKTTYTHVALDVAYQKVSFPLKDKFVTMLLVSNDQPFAESSILDKCSVPESDRSQSRYKNADLLTGLSFKRGDYLFCVKDSDTVCENSEFQWLDTSSNSLVSTRPSNTRQHPYIVKSEINCSQENGRISIGIGGYSIAAKLDTDFQLYADWSNGINSNQWKDARGALGRALTPEEDSSSFFETPYVIYYMTKNGTDTFGTSMEATFDFDTTDLIYFDEISEDDIDTMEIGPILAKTYMRHDWGFTQKADGNVVGGNIDHTSSMNVKATIALTGGTDKPE